MPNKISTISLDNEFANARIYPTMKRQLNREQVLTLMRTRQGERTSRDFAKEIGISQTYLCDIYQGKRDPGEAILKKLNLQRRIVYEQVA